MKKTTNITNPKKIVCTRGRERITSLTNGGEEGIMEIELYGLHSPTAVHFTQFYAKRKFWTYFVVVFFCLAFDFVILWFSPVCHSKCCCCCCCSYLLFTLFNVFHFNIDSYVHTSHANTLYLLQCLLCVCLASPIHLFVAVFYYITLANWCDLFCMLWLTLYFIMRE